MKNHLLLGMLIVFLFVSSSQSYEQQSLIPFLQHWLSSRPFEELLMGVHLSYGGGVVSIETLGYYYFIEFFIRKGAHFVVFGLVGLAFYQVFSEERIRNRLHEIMYRKPALRRFLRFLLEGSTRIGTWWTVRMPGIFFVILEKRRLAFIGALFCTLLCAMADEYHQSLTGGRTPSWHDVILDVSGGFVFILGGYCYGVRRVRAA